MRLFPEHEGYRLFLIDAQAWILDEPFSAIDAIGVQALEARMQAHVEAGGVMVITSHQPLNMPCRSLLLGHS